MLDPSPRRVPPVCSRFFLLLVVASAVVRAASPHAHVFELGRVVGEFGICVWRSSPYAEKKHHRQVL